MIRPPRFAADNPDYELECEEAMEFALNEVGDMAVTAGWSEEAVEAAMMKVAESRYMARRSNEITEQAIKSFRRDP